MVGERAHDVLHRFVDDLHPLPQLRHLPCTPTHRQARGGETGSRYFSQIWLDAGEYYRADHMSIFGHDRSMQDTHRESCVSHRAHAPRLLPAPPPPLPWRTLALAAATVERGAGRAAVILHRQATHASVGIYPALDSYCYYGAFADNP
eukprot:COSAG05_NODE_2831_length_2591_cov_1.839486_2_plen_148_part_00